MTITRDAMKAQVLAMLNKTPGYQGFFADDKMNYTIQECVDFVAAEMFLINEGWLNQITNINTTPNVKTYDIPDNIAMIYEVRYLSGDQYLPITYDAGDKQITNTGAINNVFPFNYRIVNNQIYFTYAPGETGTNYLQIEGPTYPTAMASGTDNLMARLDRCFEHVIKYRVASILAAQMGKEVIEWERYYNEWLNVMQNLLQKRVRQPTWIREYEGF